MFGKTALILALIFCEGVLESLHLEQMENLLFSGVPIHKDITVYKALLPENSLFKCHLIKTITSICPSVYVL